MKETVGYQQHQCGKKNGDGYSIECHKYWNGKSSRFGSEKCLKVCVSLWNKISFVPLYAPM